MFRPKRSELLLECDLAMMRFLIGNVGDHICFARLTDRKCAVAGLPGESALAFVPEVPRRACFKVLHQLSNRDYPGEPREDVDMVLSPANLERLTL